MLISWHDAVVGSTIVSCSIDSIKILLENIEYKEYRQLTFSQAKSTQIKNLLRVGSIKNCEQIGKNDQPCIRFSTGWEKEAELT